MTIARPGTAIRAPRRRVAAFGLGVAAGALGGLAMVVVQATLRLALGIPLLAEAFSDRIVPTLSVAEFLRLAARLGGLERAKLLTFFGPFALMVALGALAGGALALVLERVARAPGGPSAAARRRRAVVGASWAVLSALTVVMVVFLWPALESNYDGLPPTGARPLAAVGAALTIAAYGAGALIALRALRVGEPRPASEPRREEPSPAAPGVDRRALLVGGAGVVAGLASGALVGSLAGRLTVGPSGYDGLQTRGPDLDAITPNDRFYVVTKNLIDPLVDASRWRLHVGGLVDRPRTYTLDDIRSLPAVEQEQTLQCISNGIGGGLMSNAVWRGVGLASLVEASGVRSGARQVVMHAADGYVHTAPLAKALEPTTLLAYEMNGVPLPHRHGHPLRALVPGTFGEVSVKWIDRIELGEGGAAGYYERQGWMAQFVPTRSRFDFPRNGERIDLAESPVVRVRGVAFAGDRGVSGVEVSIDDGRTWSPAEITYAPSPLVWALWELPWRPAGAGTHFLLVRATDGNGDPQPSERRGVAPSGATGYHRVAVRVGA